MQSFKERDDDLLGKIRVGQIFSMLLSSRFEVIPGVEQN